jgi:hypothetical protein
MTKLWLVSRTDRIGYDAYDSCVVAADTEEEARYTYPINHVKYQEVAGWLRLVYDYGPDHHLTGNFANRGGEWGDPKTLVIEYLGTTDRDIKGVVLASFNAG